MKRFIEALAWRAAGFIPAVCGKTAGINPAARGGMLLAAMVLLGAQTEAPLVGRPKDFSGLVGQYSLTVTAAPTQVKVEEPIRLTVSIRALSADSQAPALKQLHLFPETFADDFHIEQPERLTEKDRTWQIEYRIRPKRPAQQTLPSLRLVYYHPQRQKYQATYSEAIELTVLPREEVKRQKLAELPGFLLEAPSDAEILQRVNPPLITYWGVPFAMFVIPPLLCFFWFLAWRRLNPAAGQARRQHSRIAERIVDELREASDADRVAAAFADYLRRRSGLRIETPTPNDVDEHLRRIGVSRELRPKCKELVQRCDEALFGSQPALAAQVRESAIQLVLALEAEPCLSRS